MLSAVYSGKYSAYIIVKIALYIKCMMHIYPVLHTLHAHIYTAVYNTYNICSIQHYTTITHQSILFCCPVTAAAAPLAARPPPPDSSSIAPTVGRNLHRISRSCSSTYIGQCSVSKNVIKKCI